MGILRRFFGESKAPNDGAPHPDASQVLDPIAQLLVNHGLPALDKQLHLSDLVGEADWLLDQDAGTLTFGGMTVCAAQVLGSQSDAAETWLWAWANSSVPEHVARDAVAVRKYGTDHGIEELTRDELPLGGSITGEALALIASELTHADAYYRGPFEGGAVFVLLRLPEDAPRPAPADVLRAVRTLSIAPMALAIPLPRQVVANYVRSIGLIVEDSGRDLVGRDAGGESLTVAFDLSGRIKAVTSTLRPL